MFLARICEQMERKKKGILIDHFDLFFFSNTIMMSPLIQCLVRSFSNGDVKWKREGMMYVNISQEKNGGWNSVNRSIERDNRWLPIGMTHWTSCSHVIDERWFDSFVRSFVYHLFLPRRLAVSWKTFGLLVACALNIPSSK